MQQRPISVTIFGILNIGFGVLGIVGVLITTALRSNATLAGNPMVKQMLDDPWAKLTMPYDGVAAALLMVAGIGLLLSKNWGRNLSFVYATYAILECIAGCIVKIKGGTSGFMILFMLFGVIIALVYPVLLIVFMTRPKVVAALKPAESAA